MDAMDMVSWCHGHDGTRPHVGGMPRSYVGRWKGHTCLATFLVGSLVGTWMYHVATTPCNGGMHVFLTFIAYMRPTAEVYFLGCPAPSFTKNKPTLTTNTCNTSLTNNQKLSNLCNKLLYHVRWMLFLAVSPPWDWAGSGHQTLEV